MQCYNESKHCSTCEDLSAADTPKDKVQKKKSEKPAKASTDRPESDSSNDMNEQGVQTKKPDNEQDPFKCAVRECPLDGVDPCPLGCCALDGPVYCFEHLSSHRTALSVDPAPAQASLITAEPSSPQSRRTKNENDLTALVFKTRKETAPKKGSILL